MDFETLVGDRYQLSLISRGCRINLSVVWRENYCGFRVSRIIILTNQIQIFLFEYLDMERWFSG